MQFIITVQTRLYYVTTGLALEVILILLIYIISKLQCINWYLDTVLTGI
jgi:hypothetical protein